MLYTQDFIYCTLLLSLALDNKQQLWIKKSIILLIYNNIYSKYVLILYKHAEGLFPTVLFQQVSFIYREAFNNSVSFISEYMQPYEDLTKWVYGRGTECGKETNQQFLRNTAWQHQNCLFSCLFFSPQVQQLSHIGHVSVVCLLAWRRM